MVLWRASCWCFGGAVKSHGVHALCMTAMHAMTNPAKLYQTQLAILALAVLHVSDLFVNDLLCE